MAAPRAESAKGRHHLRNALDPLANDPPAPSRMSMVSQAIFAPFTHKKSDSTRILSDLAPILMAPRVMNAAAGSSTARGSQTITRGSSDAPHSTFDFSTIGRAPLRLGLGRRVTSQDLQIIESTGELLASDVPEPEASDVSLFRGFNATIPSSEKGKSRRRKMRNMDVEGELGLKKMSLEARGLLEEAPQGKGKKGKRRGRESLGVAKVIGRQELNLQKGEIMLDKENVAVRRAIINSEIAEIENKIISLETIRQNLENALLKLHEEELELDDELVGIQEQEAFELSQRASTSTSASTPNAAHTRPSRRRKGPAFLPSEHDELPPGVAFMTLSSHTGPISALDFTEPYGLLVSAAQDESTRVWDLCSGEEIGRLRGHSGMVKAVQVEDYMCITAGVDATVRLWDLRNVEEDDELPSAGPSSAGFSNHLSSIPDMDEDERHTLASDDGEPFYLASVHDGEETSSIRSGSVNGLLSDSARGSRSCVRVLEGHTKAVTALYFEEDCLVTGASDKTLRQWDVNTGQCVLSMDILWAISHPPTSSMSSPASSLTSAGAFAVPTPPYADGSWEMYQDFVGAVQFWGYALVSGSGDGGVRMWDMRTGQAHRTLVGHTAPVTTLQFDDVHIISGSLDKSIRIWDLRTGGISDTIRYEYPVTSLQFDSRKIVACTGENGVKVYNRTTLQQSTFLTNGHTHPLEKLRYMDRYLVTGARDHTLKIWAL